MSLSWHCSPPPYPHRHLTSVDQCCAAARALGLLDTTATTLTNTATMLARPAGCFYDPLNSGTLVWNPRQADGTYQEDFMTCGTSEIIFECFPPVSQLCCYGTDKKRGLSMH